ncbi:MAG: hypothetical protein AAGC55_29990 [Myxococcota bacterium]
MRRDLNELFRDGMAAAMSWNYDEVERALSAAAVTCPGHRVVWEPGGEQWGWVLDASERVLALVCARIPLGAIRRGLVPIDGPEAMVWLRFESLDDRDFTVRPEVLEQVFGRPVSRAVDYRALSLRALWQATGI